jgi:hypothetical protein
VSDRIQRLPVLIRNQAELLKHRIDWADPERLLLALVDVESASGRFAIPRHEASFDYGGRWYNKDLARRWGAWAACSYSSFQIMYPVAVELGFDPERSPGDLNDDDIAVHWAIAYINRRILDKGAKTIKDFADAYNSGSHRDAFVPTAYCDKFAKAYRVARSGGV